MLPFSKSAIIGLGAVLLVVGTEGLMFIKTLGPAEKTEEKEVTIVEGNGVSEIATILKETGLIQSEKSFKIYTGLSGAARSLKPGLYFINNASIPEIVKMLEEGPVARITIPEGLSLYEIDELLSEEKVIVKGSLVALDMKVIEEKYWFLEGVTSLEGYLFPDTYEFLRGSDPEKVAEKMLANFETKVTPLLHKDNKNVKKEVIVASLIEKEVPHPEDRSIVAGIIYKRLAADIPLQIDASVCYAEKQAGCVPRKEDLSIDSPYNTYKYYGLPPTPIANPGLDTLEAAVNPETSPYWYYVSDPITRETIFARTLDEHNENIANYLKK